MKVYFILFLICVLDIIRVSYLKSIKTEWKHHLKTREYYQRVYSGNEIKLDSKLKTINNELNNFSPSKHEKINTNIPTKIYTSMNPLKSKN